SAARCCARRRGREGPWRGRWRGRAGEPAPRSVAARGLREIVRLGSRRTIGRREIAHAARAPLLRRIVHEGEARARDRRVLPALLPGEQAVQQAPPADDHGALDLGTRVDARDVAVELDEQVPFLIAHLLAGARYLPCHAAFQRATSGLGGDALTFAHE